MAVRRRSQKASHSWLLLCRPVLESRVAGVAEGECHAERPIKRCRNCTDDGEIRLANDQLKRLREALRPYGIALLDTEWNGWNAQYRFQCESGHELSRSGSYLFYSMTICPGCRDEASLRALHRIAREAGGRCLTDAYLGPNGRYAFACREGHVFEKTGKKLIEGTWCAACARARHAKLMSSPDGMRRMRAAAKARGGTCLSKTYTKLSAYYRFRCARGHEWETIGGDILRGAWCRACANIRKVDAYRRKDGLSRLQQLAQSRGGVCLSSTYEGTKAYYRFRCAQGHEWETKGALIVRGAWCLRCQHEAKRIGIDAMRALAAERGGRCLSVQYVNSATKLEWACAAGHRWDAAPATIAAGHWCAQCARDALKLGIERMREVAQARGGQCISTHYVNSSTRLEWECVRGHRWFATPNTVMNGHWCARCHFINMTTNPKTLRKQRHGAA